jgi:hypothetical protein
VRCSRSQNTALLGKLIWELLQAPDKLWVSLFNDRYLKGQLPFNVTVTGGVGDLECRGKGYANSVGTKWV